MTDTHFGAPYIDKDEELSQPASYRHIHGGFEGTDTRFRFYFPSVDNGYKGRTFNPLSGAHGGTEDFFSSPFGEAIGGLSMCFRLGGHMIESNQGHIGDEIDAKGGEDATLYGHRASAEVARFSKFVAAQIYGVSPRPAISRPFCFHGLWKCSGDAHLEWFGRSSGHEKSRCAATGPRSTSSSIRLSASTEERWAKAISVPPPTSSASCEVLARTLRARPNTSNPAPPQRTRARLSPRHWRRPSAEQLVQVDATVRKGRFDDVSHEAQRGKIAQHQREFGTRFALLDRDDPSACDAHRVGKLSLGPAQLSSSFADDRTDLPRRSRVHYVMRTLTPRECQ